MGGGGCGDLGSPGVILEPFGGILGPFQGRAGPRPPPFRRRSILSPALDGPRGPPAAGPALPAGSTLPAPSRLLLLPRRCLGGQGVTSLPVARCPSAASLGGSGGDAESDFERSRWYLVRGGHWAALGGTGALLGALRGHWGGYWDRWEGAGGVTGSAGRALGAPRGWIGDTEAFTGRALRGLLGALGGPWGGYWEDTGGVTGSIGRALGGLLGGLLGVNPPSQGLPAPPPHSRGVNYPPLISLWPFLWVIN